MKINLTSYFFDDDDPRAFINDSYKIALSDDQADFFDMSSREPFDFTVIREGEDIIIDLKQSGRCDTETAVSDLIWLLDAGDEAIIEEENND